jgi:DNA-nicking Smr family endonuclease
MSRGTRRLTSDELALWHHVTRSITPLHPEDLPPAPPPAVPTPAPPREAAAAPREPSPPPPVIRPSRRLDPTRPVDIDRRTWLKLRRGHYPIDGRLDMHGLTQDQAHARLATFLAGAASRGSRCVLVITGRGLRHGGTLRTMTPRWLDEGHLRPIVLAYAEARLEHGGEGALYVLLRRRA